MGADENKKPRKKKRKRPPKKEPLTEAQKTQLAECGEAIGDALDSIEAAGTVSREFSLARTKLDEAEMWLARGFDELGYSIGPDEEPEDDPEEGDEEE